MSIMRGGKRERESLGGATALVLLVLLLLLLLVVLLVFFGKANDNWFDFASFPKFSFFFSFCGVASSSSWSFFFFDF